jgi:hypothetical protein
MEKPWLPTISWITTKFHSGCADSANRRFSLLRTHGIKRCPGGDEEGFAVRASEEQLQGALGDFDCVNYVSSRVIDLDLTGGEVHVAARIGRYAFSALLGKETEILQAAVWVHVGGISP